MKGWCKSRRDRLAVGRAVALAQAGDAVAGFAALEEVARERIVNYQPYWAARGHLLQLLNRKEEALKALTRAASLTDDPAMREYLFKRSAETPVKVTNTKGEGHERHVSSTH
jgi:predicted RNA polymerase sigma factor